MEKQTDLLRRDLAGKVVLITGGGSGIGAALSEAFGTLGARVAIHSHESAPTSITALVERIDASDGAVLTLRADLTSGAECRRIVAETVGAFGGLDILINNAGSMVERRMFAEIDDAFIDRVFDLNARSVIRVSQAALPIFAERGGGCIINVGSISARTGGSPGSSVYSASKAFVSTLTRALAKELAEQNIRVNAISPGTVDTAFHERFSSREKLEKTRSGIPLQRLGTPDDCVGAALFLAAENLSGYVTGQVIEINGGQLLA